MSNFFSDQVPFMNIHDLDALTAELARLLGVTLAEITLPVLKIP
jgi:hypothetical protein